jgi:hypothetical protein
MTDSTAYCHPRFLENLSSPLFSTYSCLFCFSFCFPRYETTHECRLLAGHDIALTSSIVVAVFTQCRYTATNQHAVWNRNLKKTNISVRLTNQNKILRNWNNTNKSEIRDWTFWYFFGSTNWFISSNMWKWNQKTALTSSYLCSIHT